MNKMEKLLNKKTQQSNKSKDNIKFTNYNTTSTSFYNNQKNNYHT